MRVVTGLCVVVVLLAPEFAWDQGIRPIELVDTPTPWSLPRASFALNLRMQPAGSMLFGVDVGLFEELLIGVSYGGDQIIGYGEPDFNPRVEFHAKYMILEEQPQTPSFSLGFNSQGYAGYFRSPDRYRIKSKGFYGVVGKSFPFHGRFSIQGGINYSLETDDDDDEPSLFMGMEQTLGEEVLVRLEYDFAFNDDRKHNGFGEGNGYLNLGVRWTYEDRMFVEMDFCNLVGNGEEDFGKVWRTVRIGYIEFL